MAGIGTVIMLGIVIGSICVSMYLFLDEQIVTITGEPGNSITVGNVEFNIIHIGNYETLEKTKEYKEIEKTQAIKGLATSEMAEGVYFQIQITAHNTGTETVKFTGSVIDLLPDSSVTVTTQFDIPYDDKMQYTVGIIPDRFGLQDSEERGFVCIKNCY